jgi:drug/metabolite transporter (DMT)-like permease
MKHAPGGTGGWLRLVLQPWWLAGTLALLVGYGTQAVALSNGQLAIVQALLVTTIVFALPLGYFLTSQSLNRTEIGAALLVVLGLGMFTVFGDEGTGRTTAPTQEWVVTFVIFGVLAAALVLLGRHRGASQRAAYLGASAGVLYALSAAMWKPTSEALNADGLAGAFSSWEFYAWLGAAVVAFVIQQISLAAGDLAASVATVSVCNPIVSVIIGIVVLQETLSGDAWNKALAFGGLGIALFAAIIITRATEGPSDGAEVESPSAPDSSDWESS